MSGPPDAPGSTLSQPTTVDDHPEGDAVAGGAPRRVSLGRGGLRWWPVLVPLVVVLIGAWHYRWVDEDAFIDFRVVHNVLAGHGPVFNVGERVEVFSNPLWLCTLLALHEVVPFAGIEWLSVALGLACTAGGFLAGGRAVQWLVGRREEASTVLPVGLLVVSVVAGVWEFATSGLEMSMVFLWLGASFLLLVRVLDRGKGRVQTAVVLGLGTLIRPELVLSSIVLLVVLLWLVHRKGAVGGRRSRSRVVGLLAAAVALPALYQLFRMGYYGLLVPNTGLAKAGGSAWWPQGFTYLWNFVAPYTLWVPLLAFVPLLSLPVRRWWRRGDLAGVVVLLAPVVAGLVDVLYVVHLGGDYMHARLLLPAFFALCLPVAVPLRRLTGLRTASVLVIAVWSVVCAGWLRYVPPPVVSLDPQTVFISNERNSWVQATGDQNPITAGDYTRALSGQAGPALAHRARQLGHHRQAMLVITDPYAPLSAAALRPARSPLPFRLAVDVPAIGVIGDLSGPDVYLFDSYSLANPIGSHTTIVRHARPGHEKFVPASWMVARFGLAGSAPVTGLGPRGAEQVAAARRALRCAPLSSYLQAITAPMTLGHFLSDIGHSFGFTTFSFSADPTQAASELCGSDRGRG